MSSVPEMGPDLATGYEIKLHTELQAECVWHACTHRLLLAACDPFSSLPTPKIVTACRGLSVLFPGSCHPSSLQPVLAPPLCACVTVCVVLGCVGNVSIAPSVLLGYG